MWAKVLPVCCLLLAGIVLLVMATSVPDECNQVVIGTRLLPLVTRQWSWLVVILGLAMHVTAQTACLVGQGLVNGVCTYCQPGTYSSIAGQRTCRQCPAGYDRSWGAAPHEFGSNTQQCGVLSDRSSDVCSSDLSSRCHGCITVMLHFGQVLLPIRWPINERYEIECVAINVETRQEIRSVSGRQQVL